MVFSRLQEVILLAVLNVIPMELIRKFPTIAIRVTKRTILLPSSPTISNLDSPQNVSTVTLQIRDGGHLTSGNTMPVISLYIPENTKESGISVRIVIPLIPITHLAVWIVMNTEKQKWTVNMMIQAVILIEVFHVIPVIRREISQADSTTIRPVSH
jgi:hypothetical protein